MPQIFKMNLIDFGSQVNIFLVQAKTTGPNTINSPKFLIVYFNIVGRGKDRILVDVILNGRIHHM